MIFPQQPSPRPSPRTEVPRFAPAKPNYVLKTGLTGRFMIGGSAQPRHSLRSSPAASPVDVSAEVGRHNKYDLPLSQNSLEEVQTSANRLMLPTQKLLPQFVPAARMQMIGRAQNLSHIPPSAPISNTNNQLSHVPPVFNFPQLRTFQSLGQTRTR